MEYEVITANTVADLVQTVELLTRGGWEPIGGVAVSNPSATRTQWAQAMIRRAKPSPRKRKTKEATDVSQ